MDIPSAISNIRFCISSDDYGQYLKNRLNEILDILSHLDKEVSGIDPTVKSYRRNYDIIEAECCDNCENKREFDGDYFCYFYTVNTDKGPKVYTRPTSYCRLFHKDE